MSDMHSLLIAAILGVVEGLTEFLPVSSTGHMIIVGHLLGFEGDTAKTFEVVIQLGSILAVVVMFWRRLFGLIGIHFGRPLQHEGESKGRLTLIHILLGMIPAVVLGLLFHDTIKSLFNPINVMYALVVGGLLLIAAECLKPKEPRAPGLDDMTYRQAFMIGCFQCLALWPGFSRSGATISGGMLMGVSRYAASEFSFLLAVPMMMGATALDLYKSWGFLTTGDIPMFAVGFITAFVVALIAIKTFLQLIKRISFIPFAIYRFIVAAAVIVIGGLKRVAAVTEKLVPLMALFYIAGALVIVVLHAGNIPVAFAAIFRGAFNLNAAGGGALGYGISQTITWGFKRGAFSNEAGLGSAVMVNSASNVKEPVHQGMWGVFEVFADTIVGAAVVLAR